MTEALITPELLRWARQRSRLSPDAVAQGAKVKTDQLIQWERGEARPSFRQAQNLAHTLHVPFGYFFLSSPPDERPALPDLRTVRHAGFESFSADFLDVLNDVLRKQDWYREYLQEEGRESLSFIGRFSVNDDVEHVASDISGTLGVGERLRAEASSWEDFLRRFIQRAEAQGILILRSGVVGNNPWRKLSVEEFRGFAVSDDLAPLVFLNARDAKAAQIFTLAHELAHLWLGESGISNPDLGGPRLGWTERIERFSNAVAAELLVPQRGFMASWDRRATIEENLKKLVRCYRVSSLVVLRRAYDLRLFPQAEYLKCYQRQLRMEIVARERQRRLQEKAGGNFYATLLARNGSQLTRAIVSAAFEGRLLYRDAARLLSVKVKTLWTIGSELGVCSGMS